MFATVWLFALQLFCTCVMVGVIWLVQIVHYPLLRWGDPARFRELSRLNQIWTTWVVGGPMLIEAATAVWLPKIDPEFRNSVPYWVTMCLLIVIWDQSYVDIEPPNRPTRTAGPPFFVDVVLALRRQSLVCVLEGGMIGLSAGE